MPAMSKFNNFVDDLHKGVHNFTTTTTTYVLKAALTNTAPVATNATLSAITQIASGGGYTTGAGGGYALVGTLANTSGTEKMTITDYTITASGGSVGPFRYVVIYNDTPTSPADPLIGWYDYGSSITLADTETLLLDFDGTNGAWTLV